MKNNNDLKNNVYTIVNNNEIKENSLNELKEHFYNIFKEYLTKNRFKIEVEVNKNFLIVAIIPINHFTIDVLSLNSFIFEKLNDIGYYELKITKIYDIFSYKLVYDINNLN